MLKRRGLDFLSGNVGPILFGSLIMVLGFLQPGYSHAVNLVSEMGAGGSPFAPVINLAGFVLFGILVLIFSFSVQRSIPKGKLSFAGTALIAVTGIGLVGLGIFPCDAACDNFTLTGTLHTVFNRIAIGCSVMAPFLMARIFNRDRRWKGLSGFSTGIGMVSFLVWLVFFLVPIEGYAGFIQRLGIFTSLVWMEAVSFRLTRLSVPKKYWPSWGARFWERKRLRKTSGR